jgi:hypothetical protein
MADSTLNVNVVSKADLSGFKEVQAQVSTMNADIQKQLAAAGAMFDPVSNSFKSVTAAAAGLTKEVANVHAGFTITRQEVVAITNELLRGQATARSIGTSLAGLGAPIAIAGVAAFGLIETFNKILDDQEKWTTEVLRTTEEMRKLGESILEADAALRNTALIKGLPLEAGLRLAQQEVIKLKTEQSLLNLATLDGQKEFEKYTTKIQSAQDLVDQLTKGQQRQTDAVKATTDQIALNRAYGNEELTIQERVQQVYDQKLKSLLDAKVPAALAKDLASETAESERQKLEAIRGQAPAARDYNAALKEAQTILQGIRQQQQLIEGAPFMGADQKQAALLASYKTELLAVGTAMASLQHDIVGGGLDPAVLEQDKQKLQQLTAQYQTLQQKISAATLPLQAELQTWANSFGSTMTQVGHTIEQTIGASLQAVNQFLVTGKFNAQALLQQIATLGLQLVEQMIIQRAMAAINAGAAAGQAAVTGPAIAAAFAPAATAVTVATEGQAALTAPASFAAALALIEGMVFAQHGGVIPGTGTGDTVPAMLTPGEFVVNRQSAAAIGYGNLEEMNMYAAGGRVTPGRRFYGDWFWYQNPQGEMVPVQSDPTAGSPILTSDYPFSWDGGDVPGGGSPHSGGGSPSSPGSGTLPPVPSGSVDLPRYTRGPVGAMFPTLGIAGPAASGGPGIWGGMANLALHSMVMQHWAHRQGYRSAGDWLRKSGFTLPARGGGQGPGGAGRGMTKNFASGGAVTGGGAGVHIYAFTDLKALTKHMGSREGQKIIFDTVKGRRIDLGI